MADEPLVMIHGDIKTHNFLIDPETLRVTLIDFGGIGALPRSFVSFTMLATACKFVQGINQYLGYERSDNHAAMGAATEIYTLLARTRLGDLYSCRV